MSKITDLGSPDRELSAGDIRRKTTKLDRIKTKLGISLEVPFFDYL